MDDDMHNSEDLRMRNEQFRQENESIMELLNLYKENADLRTWVRNLDSTLAEVTGRKPFNQWQETFVESQFQKDLQQPTVKQVQRTSSPIDFQSFIQRSVHPDAKERAAPQSSHTEILPDIKDPERVFGEIAYQLDRRILSHVFQGHKRLYGFTLLNVQDKIREVSTHPLTGKVDEYYRLHLKQRHADLMATLQQLGYKASLHPTFSEFIINNFGILKKRPKPNGSLDQYFNNPNFLRQLINARATQALQKDLQVLLTCLCKMTETDRRPFFH
ncbi:speriolin-like protein [Gouania willdenowi]|uniref:Speriolin-like protein n=1 Tax=Gouania willdenowi TaxID=441366 RepID=A0A8C5EKS7_GOUWI|nr:speriolin-like protein [Gouania willdenowi]XP_028327338.1 speriolin-like protein [Gouania willdenowi]